ncbi:MAG: PaaI family thioesterase [Sandaracinaceae bacterium]|nr:PaaI family thioesterase [Sandaracinaceae bacterium]
MDASHFERLANMYHAAPINRLYGNRLTVSEGAAEIVWDVRADFFHAVSALHGSAYFKLLDDAAFFAANSVVPDTFVLTASFHVHFLRPVTGGAVRAEGALVSEGRHLLVAEASLFDADGHEVALGSGTFSRSAIPLTPSIGYA